MKRPGRGFTVIELMAVVVVLAVLLTLAVPAFLDLLARRRLEGVANELSADLHYARSEALTRQVDVALQTLADGSGYRITAATAPTATLIKRITLPDEVTLTDSFTLTYTAMRGIPLETSGGDLAITVSSSGTPGRMRIENNPMGRIRLCSPDGSMKGYVTC